VAEDDSAVAMLRRVAEEQGPLDGLFHAAGRETTQRATAQKPDAIDEVLRTNVTGTLMIARGFARRGVYAEKRSSLVLMSSVAAQLGTPGKSAYGASKAAVDGATRALACELAPKGIRVNAIAAGAVRTPMLEGILAGLLPEAQEAFERRHLLGFGQPEDIASAAAFLLSDAARWITGSVLTVDGGFTCH
jgi:NAD(P)-dependent dehydrogenase (short-subunit alcohol dehydrogenase family)